MSSIGHYDMNLRKRDAILTGARVSPRARARILGQPYHPPAAKEHHIAVDIPTDTKTVVSIDQPKPAPPPVPSPAKETDAPAKPEVITTPPSIASVQRVFLKILHDAGYRRLTIGDLMSTYRGRPYSWPRQICIALARRLCLASTTTLGKAFGNRDHTTVMHALRVADKHMAEWPILAAVHAQVLAAFETPK